MYRQCDASDGFFVAPVKPTFRSRVSVRFSIAANENEVKREQRERCKREWGEDVEEQEGDPHQTQEICYEDNGKMLEEARQKDKDLTKVFLEEAQQERMICLVLQTLNPLSSNSFATAAAANP